MSSSDSPPPPHALPPGFVLRPMLDSDAPQTARLHLEHLSMGIFPRLGHGFLTQWHRTFANARHAWAGVVADPSGNVVAVVLTTTDQPGHNAEVLAEHRWVMVRAGAVALLRHPRVLTTFLRTRAPRYLRRLRAGRGDAGRPVERPRSGEVSGVVHVVVTHGSARGRGLAAALLEAAEDHARRRGTTVLALVTDYPGPGEGVPARGSAAGMYERLGWKRTDVRFREGRRIAEYRRRLAVEGAGAEEDGSGPG